MNKQKPLSLPILLANWLSVSIIFITSEAVSYYGALAGIAMVLALMLAYVAVLPRLKNKMKGEAVTSSPKKTSISTKIISFETFFLSSFVGSMLVENLTHFPIAFSIWLPPAVAMVFVMFFYKMPRFFNGMKLANIVLIFIVSIFFPIYIYLQEGLETVYHNLLHYYPKVLHLEQDGLISFFIFCFLIFFTKLTVQLTTIHHYVGVHSFGKAARKLFAAVVIASSIILALSTMTIVAITQSIEVNHQNYLLSLFIQQKASPTIYLLFTNVLLGIATINLGISLKEIVEVKPYKPSITDTGLLMALLVIPFFYKAEVTVLDLFLASGAGLMMYKLLFLPYAFWINRKN